MCLRLPEDDMSTAGRRRPSVAGPHARHGVDGGAKPPKAPMSLADAQVVFGRMFESWAAMKIPVLSMRGRE